MTQSGRSTDGATGVTWNAGGTAVASKDNGLRDDPGTLQVPNDVRASLGGDDGKHESRQRQDRAEDA